LFREELTNGLPSLDFRISVSEDDMLSDEGGASVDEEEEELDSDECTDRSLSCKNLLTY